MEQLSVIGHKKKIHHIFNVCYFEVFSNSMSDLPVYWLPELVWGAYVELQLSSGKIHGF